MARRVMIMGCGRVGALVAGALAERGDQVTILDTDPDSFRRLSSGPAIQAVLADGSSPDELRDAGIEGTAVFLALSSRDSLNALAAQTARAVFGVERVVCQMNDPVRREIYEREGLIAVSPTSIAADLVLEAVEA
jgi:trk system potassium uptake protein TrkA